MSSGTLITLLIAFLALSAVFSASETALFAMPRARLRRLAGQGGMLSEVFRQVLEEPHRVLVGILFGNTLASVAATAVSALLVERWVGGLISPEGTLVAQLVVMSFLLLVLGEMAPKTYALEHGETSAPKLAYFVRLVAPLLRPFERVLVGLSHASSRLLGGGRGGASLEDLQNLIEEGKRQGTLSTEEALLFSGAFHLRQLSAADVMKHREDLVVAPVDSAPSDLIELINASGHTRILIYERTIDRIVGVVDAADLLPHVLDGSHTRSIRDVMRPPLLVPPSRSLEELLLNMQRQRLQMVVVARTSGETLGIVTVADIVEEVVGEIQGEFEEEEAAVRLLEDGSAIVQATVRVSDVNRLLGTSLPSENGGTVSNLVHRLWRDAPSEGDEKETAEGDWLSIETMVGTRVWSVRIRCQEGGEAR